MDEIWFRLSNQLEALQIQLSVTGQQIQQILVALYRQGKQFLHNVMGENYYQTFKDFGSQILALLKQAWENLTYNLSFNISLQRLNYQITDFVENVTRREVFLLASGITIGALLGFSIGLNWHGTPNHLHQMKAIICDRYIGLEGVSIIEDAEMPRIQGSKDLLIQVFAAALDNVDVKICSGYSKVYRRLLNKGKSSEFPLLLGRSCAGCIIDIGSRVINFDIGDEVYLAVPSWAPGTMAEFIVVPEDQVFKKPKTANFEACASLSYSGCLAWDALVTNASIQEGKARGKRVLIYGGNTPIGCVLIQLVKIWGGQVIVACKKNAVRYLRALGADYVVSIGETHLEKELEFLDEYDVIFYTGSLPIAESTLKKYLKPGGAFVSTAPEKLTSDSLDFVTGSVFAIFVKIRLLAQFLFGTATQRWKEGSKIKQSYLHGLQKLVDSDQLQIITDSVLPIQSIDEALQLVSDPDLIGNVVISFK